MSEQRMVDANAIELHRVTHDMGGYADLDDVEEYIGNLPTIDPETLPIVRELREKLERYEKAEQEGRLIELPCKIGDTVWVTTCATSRGIEVVKCEVRKMRIKNDGKTIGYSCCGRYKSGYLYNGNFVFNSIGKTVFLTREEAEAALKEREE